MYDRILVPTDGSDGAAGAADHAIEIATLSGATLHVLYVVDVRMSPISPGMDHDEVVALLEDVGGKPTVPIVERAEAAGVDAVEAIRIGVPHRAIRDYVEDRGIDLVVMGTHGRTGLDHALLGSVAERVVRTVDVPVTTVPIDGE